ncbi:saccharopine dehydrogenase NADP-binding domain-containing protein [Planococcus sp. CP5-4]|uniref:saccharopine dehydrogenase family protein n=1 Tax=unclassified Planococcus (in: firmicutes) TaxID=2662419 RepID=UPI001C24F86F|nr:MULTISPECIES: saccharopine dehydrogenase C-terminal domain-containing protein [unclassified Planococcus (in: firmicutes)]MBU9673097.1 saccharopine dehydrogenase NADP-binding domain-containing protein [Planococcus sp. CP5-4_YE]MBV0908343.1 saccharopine dehydrogenase NADP-binding domain-containing protein [Planococcus sp. CP5-4_UN]MBW6062405.1 saccharopine dehydrogenase NADP-binding domain-containing protein [Planococcus sp. CP5-4]
MKFAVLGAGLMGKQAARDLLRNEQVEKVVLADRTTEKAEAFRQQLNDPRLEIAKMDASRDDELKQVMARVDIVINALFYTFNEKVAKIAIECGVHSVDLGGHIGGATDKVLAMHEQASNQGVTIIPDLGVAPGMINILTGYGASQLDEVESIRIYVGGIPLHPKPPLEYKHVFSLEGVFDHYTDTSHVIRDGELEEVESLSEIEPISFDGFNELEAFHTSGGTSTLTKTFWDVNSLEYKTIRYQGHANKFRLLVELGLTDRERKVNAGGHEVSLREVLLKVLEPITELGDEKDAVLLRVTVSGVKQQEECTYQYEMVTIRDESTGVTAMAQATAYSISVVAQMIAGGLIQKRGVYPPEQIVPGAEYITEMKKRGVNIEETVQRAAHYN